jgi:GAF domain-containing protein
MDNYFDRSIIPDNEEARLKALHYYDVLDNLPENFFTNLTHIVAQTFAVPIALISMVAEEEVHFKGNIGMEGTDRTERGMSLCSLAVLDAEPTIFKDALKDPCLLRNPLVVGDFGLRFYAGAPIKSPDGFMIGTVCVVDKEPREFTETEKELLQRFAQNAMDLIQLRKSIHAGFSPLKP